jgi:hypothetical protein
MAIDSAEKRRAISGIAAHPMGPSVTPNASQDAEWRQQVAWSYSGIAADEPPEVIPGSGGTGNGLRLGLSLSL